jgi:hypothetical protein
VNETEDDMDDIGGAICGSKVHLDQECDGPTGGS